jgi:hypothetical protein
LGKYASVFQTEIYTITQCAYENIRRAYENKRILIFSDSQAALKVLSGPKVTSRLVLECQEALSALANRNEVTLMWVRDTGAFLAMKRLTDCKARISYAVTQSRAGPWNTKMSGKGSNQELD